jgi:hypothetical protein
VNYSKVFNIGVLTAIAVVLGILFPGQRSIVAVAWTLWTFAYVLTELRASVARRLLPRISRFDQVIMPTHPMMERPQDLIRCEHAFGWKVYEPRDFDHHVRPLLRELIGDRVRRRYGTSLEYLPESIRNGIDSELLALAGDVSAAEIYSHSIRTAHIADLVDRIDRLP